MLQLETEINRLTSGSMSTAHANKLQLIEMRCVAAERRCENLVIALKTSENARQREKRNHMKSIENKENKPNGVIAQQVNKTSDSFVDDVDLFVGSGEKSKKIWTDEAHEAAVSAAVSLVMEKEKKYRQRLEHTMKIRADVHREATNSMLQKIERQSLLECSKANVISVPHDGSSSPGCNTTNSTQVAVSHELEISALHRRCTEIDLAHREEAELNHIEIRTLESTLSAKEALLENKLAAEGTFSFQFFTYIFFHTQFCT